MVAALAGTIVLGAPEASVAQPAGASGSQLRVVITGLDGNPLQPGETFPVTAEGRFAAAAAKGNEPSREQASPEFQAATAALANRSVDEPMSAQEIPHYLLELCKKDARAETATGHVFHRLFWCQRYGLKAKAYRGTVLSGEVTLKWIAVAIGNYKIRTNTFMLQPTFAGDGWGDFGNVATTSSTGTENRHSPARTGLAAARLWLGSPRAGSASGAPSGNTPSDTSNWAAPAFTGFGRTPEIVTRSGKPQTRRRARTTKARVRGPPK